MEKIKLVSCELCITDHCNLSCAQCIHFSPYLKIRNVNSADLYNDLHELAKVVHSEEIRISGGEPLLHPNIIEILDTIRKSGIAERIMIITNGVLVHKMTDDVWNRIDQLWLDVYPQIKYDFNENKLYLKAKQHNVKVWVRRVKYFRISTLNQSILDTKLVAMIFRECRMVHAWSCVQIHEGRIYKCFIAPYITEKLIKLGIESYRKENDGISIHNNNNLFNDLRAYFASKKPLNACQYCLGTIGKAMQHTQLNAEGIKNELLESHYYPKKLISIRNRFISRLMIFFGTSRFVHGIKRWSRYQNSVLGFRKRNAPGE